VFPDAKGAPESHDMTQSEEIPGHAREQEEGLILKTTRPSSVITRLVLVIHHDDSP